MNKRELVAIFAVVLIGLLAALALSFSDKKTSRNGHDHGHGDDQGSHGQGHAGHVHEGPHGGKILKEGNLQLEVLIYEKGTPPYFRVYCYNDKKPLDPREVKVSIELKRLGERASVFDLVPDKDFLFSREEVEEPHSFEVKVIAERGGESFEWEYWKIEGRVELGEELARKIGIATDEAGPGKIKSVTELPGEVAFNADRISHIVPRVSGVAVQALKNLGDFARQGEAIAVLDSRELGEAKSKYLVALEREKLALYNFERAQRLWEKQTIPEKEFLTSQKSYQEEKIESNAAARKLVTMGLTGEETSALASGSVKDLTHFSLRAPFDGVVVKKHLAPGEWVKEDAEIYVIADLSTVWVEITLYAKDLGTIGLGHKATVKYDSSGMETTGIVSYIGPVVGEETRTAKARVVVENLDHKWRPGMFVKVEVVREETEVPLVVRAESIQTYRNLPVVFVKYEEDYEYRPLTLGRTDGQFTEVLKGLSPGETYVSRNGFILKAELGKAGMSHQH
ncbi:MAG: efflux RND transporter periplasmic adaptor subunit [Desulfomonile tiedjei]|uniref:Efflux RND transporter periplasmic adaptor subunit n=1 Tax=Desulfomonile tiedjei TaxID=2358 RepID=A0A9D6Z643_9BACT|nr:efflux RND transporter periplasmic adaptor subunit [Desulfomonile tiedjei]